MCWRERAPRVMCQPVLLLRQRPCPGEIHLCVVQAEGLQHVVQRQLPGSLPLLVVNVRRVCAVQVSHDLGVLWTPLRCHQAAVHAWMYVPMSQWQLGLCYRN